MKAFNLVEQDILQELKEAPALHEITFVSAYARKPFQTPVKGLTASVGIDGVKSHVKGGALSERILKEKQLIIAIDLLSPLGLGGKACAETLAEIAQVLECGGDNTQHRKIESYPVKYDSNACAFKGTLKLTVLETLHDGESQLEEDARTIGVSINGLPVFFVQNAQAESENRVFPAECFGEGGARFFCLPRRGAFNHTRPFFDGKSATDIFSLDNFTVRMKSGGRNVLFEGCHWEHIEQSFQSGKYMTEKAVIRAEKRVEMEESE